MATKESGLKPEKKMVVKILFRTHEKIEKPAFGITIHSDLGLIHGAHSGFFDLHPSFPENYFGVAEVIYEKLNLLAGQYFVEAFVLRDVFSNFDTAYDITEKKFFQVDCSLKIGVGTVFIETKFRFYQA